MTRKKKRFTTAIALVSGICLFSGAALASYNTANGYAAYKKAIKGALYESNYTLDAEFSATIDGEVVDSSIFREKIDEESNTLSSEDIYSSRTYSNRYMTYYFDDIRVDISKTNIGTSEEERVSVLDGKYKTGRNVRNSSHFSRLDENDETEKRMVKFAEMLADALTGDIKNNFVYVSGDDEKDSYELRLSSAQIPELYKAAVSVMFADNADMTADRFDKDDPYKVLGADPEVTSAICTFDLDKKGRLLNTVLRAELVGTGWDAQQRTVTFELNGHFSDYGTTVPERIDIDTLDIDYRESNDLNIRYYETEGDVTYGIRGNGQRVVVTVGEHGELVPTTESVTLEYTEVK